MLVQLLSLSHSSSSRGQGDKIRLKGPWVRIKTGKLVTNYNPRQNRYHSGKINVSPHPCAHIFSGSTLFLHSQITGIFTHSLSSTEGMEVWSFHKCSSLLLLFLLTFRCFSMSPSHVLQGKPSPEWTLAAVPVKRYPPAPTWGSTQAAGWISNPPWTSSQSAGKHYHHCGLSFRLQGNFCFSSWSTSSLSFFFNLSISTVLSHTSFPLHSLVLALSEMCFHREATSLADGLSCVLQWVCWSWLETAVSDTGSSWPLLRETSAPCHCQNLDMDIQYTHAWKSC